jgi:hypothetical protein
MILYDVGIKTCSVNAIDYKLQLRRLVRAGIAMRETAVIDDDFPEMMHRFDSELRAAEQLLKEARDG